MMSLCPAIPDKKPHKYIPISPDIAPLLARFSKVSSTVSCLLAMHDWRLSRSEDGSSESLDHNIVFLHDPQLLAQSDLLDVAKHLEIIFVKGWTDALFKGLIPHL